MSSSSKKTFTVVYCANCDGGQQELGAASEAIRRVFPSAKIEATCLDEYPIHVDVMHDGQVLWTAPQRELFRKNPTHRQKSQDAIAAAVRAVDPSGADDE